MCKRTDARQRTMNTLTLDERERIADSALMIQSVRKSLKLVAAHKVPSMRELLACLKSVDENLRASLGYFRNVAAREVAAEPE